MSKVLSAMKLSHPRYLSKLRLLLHSLAFTTIALQRTDRECVAAMHLGERNRAWGRMARRSQLQSLFIAILMIVAPAAAEDWPQWRGPGRNGLVEKSAGLVSSLTAQSPMWQSDPIASGEQGGRGSLIVYAGRVYGMTRVLDSSQSTDEVFCLNAETGKSVWRSRLSPAGVAESGSSTPCIADNRLYIVGSGAKVHCLNANDGQPIWEATLSRSIKNPIASSIAVVEGVVVLLADVLTGLDAKTGQALWTQDAITGHESSPAQWSANGRYYVICNTDQETHGVDPTNGKLMWSVEGGGKSTPVVAQEYGGDFLINMSDSRKSGLSAHRLKPDGPEKLWTVQISDRASSPVVYDGHVYAVAGGSNGHGAHILCVHIDTGQVIWDETIDFAEVSSPIVADGKVIAVFGTFLSLFQATPDRLTVLGQANLQITLCTSPAIFDGRLYVRQPNSIACYDLRAIP